MAINIIIQEKDDQVGFKVENINNATSMEKETLSLIFQAISDNFEIDKEKTKLKTVEQ